VNSPAADLKRVHQAYTVLSEKFKTLWTFHQFLQGLHKTLFNDEPSYRIAFAPVYEQIKKVKDAKNYDPPEKTLLEIAVLDTQLNAFHTTLQEDDRRVAPNAVRQFFEKFRSDDEKLLVSILKFYFYARQLTHDELDKVDYLFTRLGTRKPKAGGGYELRTPEELRELCAGFLSLTGHEDSDPEEVRAILTVLDLLRKDIEACERFEDLSRKGTLENIRTVKHRMGSALYSPEVLQAVLGSNVAAKEKFQALYQEEDRRILESCKRVAGIEKELQGSALLADEGFQADLERFNKEREEFEKVSSKRGVRHRDVKRLREALDALFLRLEPAAAPEPPLPVPPRQPIADTAPGRDPQWTPTPPGLSSDSAVHSRVWQAETDGLTSNAATRILSSVDLVTDEPERDRQSVTGPILRMKLEPWEVHAALRIPKPGPGDPAPITPVERLYFNAVVLRLRIDEEAQQLRVVLLEAGEQSASGQTLDASAKCLARAQELDRQFRALLREKTPDPPAVNRNELMRSRFRHLRAFAGLWLLYNALGGR
jgi:hypothetical protein